MKLTNMSGMWAEPIGRAFLAFGSIEHAVLIGLRDIPIDSLQRAVIRMPLASRIDLLVEIIESRPEVPYFVFATVLKKAKEQAKIRNILAHNPLILEVYETGEGNFLTTEVIAAMHNKKHRMSFTELNEFVREAEGLSEQLYECLARIRQLHFPE
jgi:hypothetical protein